HRAESVDELRPVRALGHPPRPYRPRRTQGEGHQLPHLRHARPGRDRSPPPPNDGERGVQRGLPRRGLRSTCAARRRGACGLGDRQHDPRARARHFAAAARHPPHAPPGPPPPRGRGRERQPTPGRGCRPPPTSRPPLDGGRDPAPQQLANAHAPRPPRAARARVELHQALLERDEPAHARHADGPPRPGGSLLAARATGHRGRAAHPLLPLLPRRFALRRHLGDPAEHPGRAGARAPAGALMDAALDAESLIGPRVSLRPFSLEDVPAVLAYASDPEVTRHLEWDAYDDPKTAMAFIRSTHAGTAWIAPAIVLRTDDRLN